MANFFAWVTATTNLSADPLIAGLVREGYEVKVLADSGNLIEQGEISCLISLRICRTVTGTPGQSPQRQVLEAISGIYERMGATYHSIIVQAVGGSVTWEGSNIKLPPTPAPAPPAKTKYDRLNEEDDADQEKKKD